MRGNSLTPLTPPLPLPLTPHPSGPFRRKLCRCRPIAPPRRPFFPGSSTRCRMATPARRSSNSTQRFRRDKQYRRLFDARLMQKRLELGLPLVSAAGIGDVPKELQQAYQDASVHAAREVGELILADRDIPQAWPYFRAIGDTGPIVQALDTFDVADADTPESQEALGAAIHIAFQEGVHPRKGFELILKHYGLCRAITMFGAYPERDGRQRIAAPARPDRSMARSSRTSGTRSRTSKEHSRKAIRLPRSSKDAIGSSRTTRSIPTVHTSRRCSD